MSNRVAFITGASRGIGRAIALKLCQSGLQIVVASPELENNELVAAEVRAAGGTAITLDFNLTSLDSIKQGVAAALKEFGKIDVLVNNAGITRDGLLLRMKPEDFDLVISINLKGTFNYTCAVLPAMLKQRAGRIVNVASVMGLVGNPGQANYSASKAGVIGLTRTTAKEVASRGITVNAVAPGFIETAMTQKLPEAARAEILKRVPLGVVGQPEDVANGVLFLASDAARYITGHVLVIDGGLIE
jgi:3-oxoacyl-[acyl-carrier protein] reductase